MASAPEVVHEAMPQFSTMPEAKSQSGWWSSLSHTTRLLSIAAAVVLAAAIIGIVVGVVVHDKANRSPAPAVATYTTTSPTSVSSSGPSTPTPTSVCRGTFCPSMLSVVEDSTPSAPSGSKLFFALGQDKLVWYRRGDGATWFSDWTSLNSNGINILSQPDAVTFEDDQTNIWVVDANSKMQVLAYKSGVWDGAWLDLGGSFTTPMTSCSRESGSLSGFCASAMLAVCGNNSVEVVVYGGYQGPFTFDINVLNGSQWSDWQGESSNMKGDPFAISFSPNRSDYFGIGEDGAMYYTTWTSSAGYGALQYLGGSFESTPFAIANGNNRVDVLAVGTDDHLKHKALIGLSWSPDWDDLGGSFNSAPVAFYTPSGLASVFGIANNGSLFHGTWTVGSGASWTNGDNWTVDGGAMSTTWFRGAIS
ncbi:hypothetical protein N431DRAFT_540503 [Stipitochalara longipes BDJ]|nr:hypothetical protein N431DRAFT_540503 [Stipitochalara longipes BDJ]